MSDLNWTRRRWLTSVSAAMTTPLFLPFIRDVAAQESGAIPRRFVFVIAGNGIESHLLSTPEMVDAVAQAGGEIGDLRFNFNRGYQHDRPLIVANQDLATAPGLEALSPANGERDLRSEAAVLFGLSSKIAGGGHGSGYGALSCSASRGGVPTAISIDSWLGQQSGVGPQRPFEVVRLGVVPKVEQRLQYGLCAFGARRPASVIVDPEAAFRSLFASVADGPARQAFTNRSTLLDFAAQDVRRTLQELIGADQERAKLETYLESLETLRQRQGRLLASEAQLRAVIPQSVEFQGLLSSTHPLERLSAQFELATASLLGGLTSVAVIACGAGDFALTYSSLESIFEEDPNYRGLVDRHTLCHEAGGNPTYQRILDTVTRRQVELTSTMARRLQAVPERDGTMLDHTVFVFMSDNGDQHHSPASEWPTLLLGGRALGLQTTGQTIVYPAEGETNHRQISNLFNTLGYCAGEALDDFGGEGGTRVSRGPLPELLA